MEKRLAVTGRRQLESVPVQPDWDSMAMAGAAGSLNALCGPGVPNELVGGKVLHKGGKDSGFRSLR